MDVDYRILIPVTTQAARLKRLVDGISDKSKLIIVHNYNHPRCIEVGKDCGRQGAEIIPFEGDNRGSCISWNIGLRKMDTTLAKFVAVFSPGTQLPRGADTFVNAILDAEKKMFYGIQEDAFHTVAITKELREKIGLFDENLYPAYRDDADWQRRMALCGATSTRFDIETELTLGTGVRNHMVFAHYWANIPVQNEYYTKKWGGDVGAETYDRPFKTMPLDYWLPDQTKKVRLSQITKAMADSWINNRCQAGKEGLVDGSDKEWE